MLVASAVALCLAATACGSSSSGTGSTNGSQAATNGSGSVKGSEYKATSNSSTGSGNTTAAGASSTTAATTTATSASSSTAATTTAASQQSTTSSVHVRGCRSVPAPPSRAGEQASKSTAQLNPTHSYTVRLVTNCGPILIQLAVKQAPKTSSSFAHLVKLGYYNGLIFHRVVPNFVIQGGDPNGNGSGGPSWTVVEPPPSNLRYVKGVVAMAKSTTAPSGASGSQFFIVTGANVGLPPIYALVGRVIGSERAVEAIARVPTEGSTPLAPMVIERATLSVH